jgi:peroxiredoxin
MKKRLISIMVVLAVLAVAWPASAQGQSSSEQPGQQGREGGRLLENLSPEERAKMRERWEKMSPEEREQFRAQIRERLAAEGRTAARGGALEMVEAEIAKLKAEHEELAKELEVIRELAKKENANETTQRLDRLIAKRNDEFINALDQLERRHQRLQAARSRPVAAGETQGRRAPDFTLQSFDGKTVSLSDYRGKIVVLEWLNFECPFVRYHYGPAKTMIKLAEKYKDKNVVWLAINSTSHTTPEANKEFAEAQKLPYPILDDRSGRVGHAYVAMTTPHMFVISTRGNIVYEGAIDNAPMGKTPEGQELVNYVDKALAELTGGKAVSTTKTKPYGCSVKYRQEGGGLGMRPAY